MTRTDERSTVDDPALADAVSPLNDPPVSRLALLLLAAGLVAVVVGQLLLLPQLLSPEIPGSIFDVSASKRLFALNGLLVAATGVAALILPAKWRLAVLTPSAGLAALTLVGSLTVGGHAVDALAALLTFSTIWLAGRAIRRRATDQFGGLPVVDLVLGAGALGLAVQVFGRLGVIAWWSTGLLVIAAGTAGLVVAGRIAKQRHSELTEALTASPVHVMAASLILLQGAWSVIYLSAPDIMFDALYGKAYLPALWAQTGSIGPLVETPALNLAGLTQMMATPGHTLSGADTGRWLQDLAWLAVAGTIWAWGGRRSVIGPLVAAIVAITPHLLWQNSTAFDDNVLLLPAAALTLAVLSTLAKDREPASLGTALVMGLLAGSAVWFKLHLLVLTTVVVFGWLVLAGPARSFLARTAAAAAGAVLIAGPAMALRWIDTGNPLFPSYNNIFKSKYAPATNETFNFPFWPDAGSLGPLKLPYQAVVNPASMSEAAPPGMYGLLIVLVVASLVLGWRARERRAALVVWVGLAVALVAWWIQLRYLRYALPLAVSATLLLMLQLRGWRPGRAAIVGTVALLGVAGAAFLPSSAASFWNVPERKPPFGAAFGRWDSADYLRTVFPEKDALEAYKRSAPAGALAVSDAHERLFVGDRRLTVLYETATRMTLVPPAPQNGEEAFRKLRQLGITWAVIQTNGATLQNYPWLQQALQLHGQPVFADRGWAVVRLVDRPAQPVPDQGCDETFRAAAGCWGGTLDRMPGLATGETVNRVIRACPGTVIALQLTAAAGGAPSTAVIDPDGTTGKSGFSVGTTAPGTSTWIYATVPKGAKAATITLTPGADGARITRATTARLGPACAG